MVRSARVAAKLPSASVVLAMVMLLRSAGVGGSLAHLQGFTHLHIPTVFFCTQKPKAVQGKQGRGHLGG